MIVGKRSAARDSESTRAWFEQLLGAPVASAVEAANAPTSAAADTRYPPAVDTLPPRTRRGASLYIEEPLALAGRRDRPAPPGEPHPFDHATTEHGMAFFTGRLYNQAEVASAVHGQVDSARPAQLLLALHARDGDMFARQLVGPFAFAILEAATGRLLLGRDHLGLEPLYYTHDKAGLHFASTIKTTLQCAGRPWQMNYQAMARTLLFNYNPGPDTLARGVNALPPGHVLIQKPDNTVELQRYWRLSFSPQPAMDDATLRQTLLDRFREAVTCRLSQGSSMGVFLSGGLDSSTVAALAAEQTDATLHSYAFRCDEASCDESQFAQIMADAAGTEHQRVDYTAAELTVMAEAVGHMAEPFDEAGINVASYLLGQRALRHDAIVLTGDGGDELFAGHPVYQADALASRVDRLPRWLTSPGLAVLRQLPDSREKQDLWVKLKRFAEGLSLPAELLSNRWRVHYHPAELRAMLHPDMAEQIDWDRIFDPVIACREGADGEDLLSRSLYADYQSILSFYLRRNDMLRALGIEVRCPLLDHRLVEFCATIPARQKAPRWSDPKAIMRKAVEPILPHAITHRADKLGHSVPLKNWLREDAQAQRFVFEQLDDSRLGQRGLVRPEAIQKLIDQHRNRRRNNSHRLWTLTVLELWMQRHLDQ
jgi:asparagine synthase (glutamine-hydrolysing)